MGIFSDDTAVSKTGERTFEAAVSDNWSVKGNPNGGYLISISRQIAQLRRI